MAAKNGRTGLIAKKLGIVQFDIRELYKFTVNLLRELAESVNENNTVSSEDGFQRMVGMLSQRIIVTTECRDSRDGRGPETPRNRVNGPIAGRYILGTVNNKELAGRLILSQKEVRDWCMAGRGIMLRSLWDIAPQLAAGELVRVLPAYAMPDADIHWLAPYRADAPKRIRLLIDFLVTQFAAAPWETRPPATWQRAAVAGEPPN